MDGIIGWTELAVIAFLAILLLDSQQLRELFRLFKKLKTMLYKFRYELEDALQIDAPPPTSDLRQTTLAKVRQLSSHQRALESASLVDQLRDHAKINAANWVAAFCPTSLEPDITPWLKELAAAGRLLLPRVLTDHRMEFVIITDLDADLQKGAFNLYEPRATLPCAVVEPDIFLIPGTVFGPKGERLGRGAGYYDRYLARVPHALRIGIAFAVQCAPSAIPQKAHDIAMNQVLCGGQLKNNVNL